MKLHEQIQLNSTRITNIDGVVYTRQGETRKRHIKEVQRGVNGKSKKIARVQKWMDNGEAIQSQTAKNWERHEQGKERKELNAKRYAKKYAKRK